MRKHIWNRIQVFCGITINLKWHTSKNCMHRVHTSWYQSISTISTKKNESSRNIDSARTHKLIIGINVHRETAKLLLITLAAAQRKIRFSIAISQFSFDWIYSYWWLRKFIILSPSQNLKKKILQERRTYHFTFCSFAFHYTTSMKNKNKAIFISVHFKIKIQSIAVYSVCTYQEKKINISGSDEFFVLRRKSEINVKIELVEFGIEYIYIFVLPVWIDVNDFMMSWKLFTNRIYRVSSDNLRFK